MIRTLLLTFILLFVAVDEVAPITAEEAKALGLPVTTDMPEAVYDFMNLFPQPTRTRPAVEYVPMPYRAREGRAPSDRSGR